MNAKNIESIVAALRAANIAPEIIEQVQYDADYESTVSALEARLRGGYAFEEIITEALGTTMEFYDADSAIVISVDMDLLIAKPEFEIHRPGVMPVCGTEPLYLSDYPEFLAALKPITKNVTAFPFTEVIKLLSQSSKEIKRLEQLGIQSIMAVPFSKRNQGFVAVINPRRYTTNPEHNSLLQVLSYVVVAEINELLLMNRQRNAFFDENKLAPNDVYVKLLNGFEIQTVEGVVTEKDFKRKQSVLLLALLLTQSGAVSVDALVKDIWEDSSNLIEPERTLKNLSYTTKKSIIHLFPKNGFLEIKKSGYSIGHRYNVMTDLDWFSYQIRDAEGIQNTKARLEKMLTALNGFTGVVLPQHDHRAIEHIVERYETRRKAVQDTCLSLMYELSEYNQMREFIGSITVSRSMDANLAYWDIASNFQLNRTEQAKQLFAEQKALFSAQQMEDLSTLLGVM